MTMGRPTTMTNEVQATVLSAIAEGASLNQAAHKAGVSRDAILRYVKANEDFRHQYARAREAQADSFADEILDIARGSTEPQTARMQIDALKWLAAKHAPKIYGDKVGLEHSGPNGAPLEITRIERVIVQAPKYAEVD